MQCSCGKETASAKEVVREVTIEYERCGGCGRTWVRPEEQRWISGSAQRRRAMALCREKRNEVVTTPQGESDTRPATGVQKSILKRLARKSGLEEGEILELGRELGCAHTSTKFGELNRSAAKALGARLTALDVEERISKAELGAFVEK